MTRDKRYSLDWSLKPIFCLMRVFGIDLNVAPQPSVYRRCGFIAYGLFIFACMQSSHLSRPSFQTDDQPTDLRSTKVWLDILTRYAWALWYLIFPLAMMEMVTLLKWKAVCNRARKLSDFTVGKTDFHRHLRRFSIGLTTSMFSMVIDPYSVLTSYNAIQQTITQSWFGFTFLCVNVVV